MISRIYSSLSHSFTVINVNEEPVVEDDDDDNEEDDVEGETATFGWQKNTTEFLVGGGLELGSKGFFKKYLEKSLIKQKQILLLAYTLKQRQSVQVIMHKSSGSEQDLQHLMDQRKRKRMISNRESARRSRMRKQKHLDELATQLSQLRKENNEMMSSLSITTQHYMAVEAENHVMRVQVAELSRHLDSLNNIIGFMYPPVEEQHGGCPEFVDEFMNNSLSYVYANQPILASADTFMY
ncbi:hypothetical protein L1987_49359 [Smallanthus sonchifolius]|uniref:Uncharacterized protein n=1 Tax=Smallanthus sonchifolius TaxID=185202 RepID=A0ACB9FUA1_9ASTR|nr:hypothetical protein L1987_49359 [Smallanthus sonchifolius]